MLMPNDQQEFILPRDEVLLFEADAPFRIIDSEGSRIYAGGASYGPFRADRKILITSGASSVFIRFRSVTAPPAVVRFIGAIGTSLVNNCENINAAGKLGASSRSWIDWALAFGGGAAEMYCVFDNRIFEKWEPSGSGSRFFNGLNFGVSGQGIEDIWARVRQVYSFRENYQCLIQDGGTNDIATMRAERILFLKVMIAEYFASKGIISVVLPILARSIASWPAGSDERKKMNYINSLLHSFSTRFSENVVVHDWNQDWVDSASANGEPRANFSDDGTHFAPAGAVSVGRGLWARCLSKFVTTGASRIHSPDDVYDSVINTRGCLNPNPRIRGTAGTTGANASGVVADGYTVENISGSPVITAAASKVTTPEGAEANRIVFTLGGAQTEEFYYRTAPANISHTVPGQYVQPYARIKFNNEPDSFNSIGLEAVDQTNSVFRSTNFEPVEDGGSNELPTLVQANDEFYLIGRPFKLTDASVTLRLRLLMSMTGSGSTGADIEVSELGVKVVSVPPIFTPQEDLLLN